MSRLGMTGLLVSLSLGACSSDSVRPHHSSELSSEPASAAAFAEVRGGDVVIENPTREARWFLVLEREFANRLDLNLDPANEAQWYRVEASGAISVPLASVPGYAPGSNTLLVYSWIRSVVVHGPAGPQWTGEGFTSFEVRIE